MTDWEFAALVAIFLFGVPHGGFDAAIARRSGWSMNSGLSWVIFHLAYIAIALAVAYFGGGSLIQPRLVFISFWLSFWR